MRRILEEIVVSWLLSVDDVLDFLSDRNHRVAESVDLSQSLGFGGFDLDK